TSWLDRAAASAQKRLRVLWSPIRSANVRPRIRRTGSLVLVTVDRRPPPRPPPGAARDTWARATSESEHAMKTRSKLRRVAQPVGGEGVQYQLLVSDLFGANAGQPANTVYPCTNGDCSNWITFIDTTVNAVKNSGVNFAFDIWNEPELSIFWRPGVNTPQYFQMWDTAFREIRRLAPSATIVGPTSAFTPQSRPGQWHTWLEHVKAAGTVPDT